MTVLIIPLVMLWTLSTAKHYNDYYRPANATRKPPSGIAAYRSALTLDWLAAEDYRQRELVAAIESEPLPAPRLTSTDCIDYARPTSGGVARLMLELLKNLEGDESNLVTELVQALVRTKLLALETSLFDNEPDFEALIKTPKVMMGEPHTTFPRIVATIWMAVTDPSTVKKHGWCTVQRMTLFLQATRPSDIAKHMHTVESILSRARYIMEEFIQQVTPLNILKSSTPLAYAVKGRTRNPKADMRRIVPEEHRSAKVKARLIRTGTVGEHDVPMSRELKKRDQSTSFVPEPRVYPITPRRVTLENQEPLTERLTDEIDIDPNSSDFPGRSSKPELSVFFILIVIIALVVQ